MTCLLTFVPLSLSLFLSLALKYRTTKRQIKVQHMLEHNFVQKPTNLDVYNHHINSEFTFSRQKIDVLDARA